MVSRFRSRLLPSSSVAEWFPGATRTRIPDFDLPFMVLLVDTAAPGATTTVTVPVQGTVNCVVDWGDGLFDTYTVAANATHTYAVGGKYTIRIRGVLTLFGTPAFTRPWLVGCVSFGKLGTTSFLDGFRSCANVTQVPSRLPTTVTNTGLMFYAATSFNGNIGLWDMSRVTNFAQMFEQATVFNQNIGSWNTGLVTTMGAMFRNATSFNQNIGAWNTGAVTNMASMFSNASSFNQNIGSWNTSNVTDMSFMFNTMPFNQNIGAWDTSKVTNMSFMFNVNTAFNQNIGSWDTSNVTNMAIMFANAQSFNQDISGWNVKKVTSMNTMLSNAFAFEQNLGPWRPSRCTSFSNFLSGVTLDTANYDALLTGWTDFTGSNWDSGSITAFADAGGGQVTVTTGAAHGYANNHVMRITGTTNYNGSYVISNVTSTSFRITATWVATETGTWNATLQSGVTFHGGGSKYSVGAATTARGVLTGAPYNWTITDGGQA